MFVLHLHLFAFVYSLCWCLWYQNITAQRTPARLTRSNNRNTPLKPSTAQFVAPADQTGSSTVAAARSPHVETRSGHAGLPKDQTDSTERPAGSQKPPAGKLQSPAVHRLSEKLRSPAIEKSQRHAESVSYTHLTLPTILRV